MIDHAKQACGTELLRTRSARPGNKCNATGTPRPCACMRMSRPPAVGGSCGWVRECMDAAGMRETGEGARLLVGEGGPHVMGLRDDGAVGAEDHARLLAVDVQRAQDEDEAGERGVHAHAVDPVVVQVEHAHLHGQPRSAASNLTFFFEQLSNRRLNSGGGRGLGVADGSHNYVQWPR